MPRFMKVMGLQGKLVADPFRQPDGTPHFLGQRERVPAPVPQSKDPAEAERELHLADYYEPCEQVVKVDGAGRAHVLTAKAAGEIRLLGEAAAPTREIAIDAMAKPAVSGGKAGK